MRNRASSCSCPPQAEMSSSQKTLPKPSKKKEGCLGGFAHRNRGRIASMLSAAGSKVGSLPGERQPGQEESRIPGW